MIVVTCVDEGIDVEELDDDGLAGGEELGKERLDVMNV